MFIEEPSKHKLREESMLVVGNSAERAKGTKTDHGLFCNKVLQVKSFAICVFSVEKMNISFSKKCDLKIASSSITNAM